MRTQSQQEATYFILKKNDQCKYSHIHQRIKDGTQEFHFENLSHHNPHHEKHQDPGKDLDGTGSFHQLVCIIQKKSNQQDIDKIFYTKIKKHSYNYKLMS